MFDDDESDSDGGETKFTESCSVTADSTYAAYVATSTTKKENSGTTCSDVIEATDEPVISAAETGSQSALKRPLVARGKTSGKKDGKAQKLSAREKSAKMQRGGGGAGMPGKNFRQAAGKETNVPKIGDTKLAVQRHFMPQIVFNRKSILTVDENRKLLGMVINQQNKGHFMYKDNKKYYEELQEVLQTEFELHNRFCRMYYRHLWDRDPLTHAFIRRPPHALRYCMDRQKSAYTNKLVNSVISKDYSLLKILSFEYTPQPAHTSVLTWERCVHQVGSLPKVFAPDLRSRCAAASEYDRIKNRYNPAGCRDAWNISDDPLVQALAPENDAVVVCSPAAMQWLLIPPAQSGQWIIPLTVKTIYRDGIRRKCLFFDKPLPKSKLTSREAAERFFKYGLRTQFVRPLHDPSKVEAYRRMALAQREKVSLGSKQSNDELMAFSGEWTSGSALKCERPENIESETDPGAVENGCAVNGGAHLKVEDSEEPNLINHGPHSGSSAVGRESSLKADHDESKSNTSPAPSSDSVAKEHQDPDEQYKKASKPVTDLPFDPSALLSELASSAVRVEKTGELAKEETDTGETKMMQEEQCQENKEKPVNADSLLSDLMQGTRSSSSAVNIVSAVANTISSSHPASKITQVSYDTWKFGHHTLLIRSKLDGRMNQPDDVPVFLVAKVEYACDFGGQTMPQDELMRLWVKCLLKKAKNVFLARLHPLTGEILSLQLLTSDAVAKLIRRDILEKGFAYFGQLVSELSGLDEGAYVLRHNEGSENTDVLLTSEEAKSADEEDQLVIDDVTDEKPSLRVSIQSDVKPTDFSNNFMNCLRHLDFDDYYRPIDPTVVFQYHKIMKRFPATLDVREESELPDTLEDKRRPLELPKVSVSYYDPYVSKPVRSICSCFHPAHFRKGNKGKGGQKRKGWNPHHGKQQPGGKKAKLAMHKDLDAPSAS